MKQDVIVIHMLLAVTKSKTAILKVMVKRSQLTRSLILVLFDRLPIDEYAYQIYSPYLLQFKSYGPV